MVSVSIEAEHPGKAEFLVGNTHAAVVKTDLSKDIRITGCILGHNAGKKQEQANDEYGCGGALGTGYVVMTTRSRNIYLGNCDLYGCQIVGLYCRDSQDIKVDGCVIRDCEHCVTSGYGNRNVTFQNCIISGNAYKVHGNYPALGGSGKVYSGCTFLNNYSGKLFPDNGGDSFEESIVNCRFYDNVWDGQTPKAYGVCLNGITWQVQGNTLKIGYPIRVDGKHVIVSAAGKILDYTDFSLPWRLYKDLEPDVAQGVILPMVGRSSL